MDLDIRLPIGLMFGILGPILASFGIAYDVPLDRVVGGAMTAFGAVMGYFGRPRGGGAAGR